MFDPAVVDPAVDVLADLAGGGPRSELGHRDGPDRAAAGAPRRPGARDRAVAGDGRPGSAPSRAATRIGVTIGDFATTKVDGTFSVAYLVFNTIMNLTTQDAAGGLLPATSRPTCEPGGCFVIEVAVPDLRRLPPGRERPCPSSVSPTRWAFDVYDTATQAMSSHHYRADRRPRRVHLDPLPVRVAGGARSHGPARRAAAARALGRMGARAVHRREPPACLHLGKARPLGLCSPQTSPRLDTPESPGTRTPGGTFRGEDGSPARPHRP